MLRSNLSRLEERKVFISDIGGGGGMKSNPRLSTAVC
jgi:hypothetical protein